MCIFLHKCNILSRPVLSRVLERVLGAKVSLSESFFLDLSQKVLATQKPQTTKYLTSIM